MQTLNEYIRKNRTDSKPQTENAQYFGESYINTRPVYYDVPTENGNFKTFAFLSVPASRMPKGGYPAVVIIHGGNGAAYHEFTKAWAEKGYVAIAPDFNGKRAENLCRRDVDNAAGGPCGYGFSALSSAHPWAYFSVLSAMRAVDVLLSLKNVNPNKICTCGLSWGGFLNLSLLSQDHRIAAGSVIYSSAYTHESNWGKKQLETLPLKEQENYVRYIEPSNYLRYIRCPVLFTAGTQDIAFKMDNRRRTADEIGGKAYFALRKDFPHGNFYGFEQNESAEFFRLILSKKRVPQPLLRKEKDGKITVKASRLKGKLRLLFTQNDVRATETQKWREIPARDAEKISLPNGATAALLIEQNESGTWSSNMLLFDSIG